MTKKILSFLERERAQKIYEDVHPNIMGAIRAKPPEVLDKVLAARREVGQDGQDSGLHDTRPAKGSSRAVIPVKNDHHAMVDGKPTMLKGVLKVAHMESIGRGDASRSEEDKLVGQKQNKVEASVKMQKHATLVRDGKGGFMTNKNGLIPPVFSHHNDHAAIHIGHAEDVEDHGGFNHLTKRKGFPDGISASEINRATHPLYAHDEEYDHIRKHPLAKAVMKLRNETGISDLHANNWGVWTHPHTGKKHLVIRDAGYDESIAKDYGHYDSNAPSQSKEPTQVTQSFTHKAKLDEPSLGFGRSYAKHKTERQKYQEIMHNQKNKNVPISQRNPSTMGASTLAKALVPSGTLAKMKAARQGAYIPGEHTIDKAIDEPRVGYSTYKKAIELRKKHNK